MVGLRPGYSAPMLLISLAHAHPSALPHAHAPGGPVVSILAFWAVAALLFVIWAYRGTADAEARRPAS